MGDALPQWGRFSRVTSLSIWIPTPTTGARSASPSEWHRWCVLDENLHVTDELVGFLKMREGLDVVHEWAERNYATGDRARVADGVFQDYARYLAGPDKSRGTIEATD